MSSKLVEMKALDLNINYSGVEPFLNGAIGIVGEKRKQLGFGIAQYGATKAKELMGSKGARAVVHYDHLFPIIGDFI